MNFIQKCVASVYVNLLIFEFESVCVCVCVCVYTVCVFCPYCVLDAGFLCLNRPLLGDFLQWVIMGFPVCQPSLLLF